jgi:hypothetical protein
VAVFYLRPNGQRVYDGSAYAVQTARKFIAARAEFTSGVKNGEYDLGRRNSKLFINTAGNASTVILNGNASVRVKRHVHLIADARHRFVDGVIHDFVYEMMESSLRRRSDIHTGSLSDSLQALKNLNLTVFVDSFLGVLIFRHKFYIFLSEKSGKPGIFRLIKADFADIRTLPFESPITSEDHRLSDRAF